MKAVTHQTFVVVPDIVAIGRSVSFSARSFLGPSENISSSMYLNHRGPRQELRTHSPLDIKRAISGFVTEPLDLWTHRHEVETLLKGAGSVLEGPMGSHG